MAAMKENHHNFHHVSVSLNSKVFKQLRLSVSENYFINLCTSSQKHFTQLDLDQKGCSLTWLEEIWFFLIQRHHLRRGEQEYA